METTFNACIFIISHGRPDNVITYKTLSDAKNQYPVYIVIDNTDKSIEKYKHKYGDKVLVFNKQEIAQKTDQGDNFKNLRTTTHARNACFDLAEQNGFKYFLVLDDDYVKFDFRINHKLDYPATFFKIRNITQIFTSYFYFMVKSGCTTVCFSQGGDYIGGSESPYAQNPLTRKAMNSFFCSVDRRFWFVSRLNEDVNTYMSLGSRGNLFLTAPVCSLTQQATQGTKGGMTEAYVDGGTYVKSFYTVMYCPSFAHVKMMQTTNKRIHHSISWGNAVPVIIDEKHKKPD